MYSAIWKKIHQYSAKRLYIVHHFHDQIVLPIVRTTLCHILYSLQTVIPSLILNQLLSVTHIPSPLVFVDIVSFQFVILLLCFRSCLRSHACVIIDFLYSLISKDILCILTTTMLKLLTKITSTISKSRHIDCTL